MTSIRPAVVDDVPVMLEMLQESAAAQGFPDAVCVTESDLREDGFGPAPRFAALIAEQDGTPAALAIYFFTWSSWVSRNGLYLEDLYVRSAFRRLGLGRLLLAELARIAVNAGCGRFQWTVHRENRAALALYESFGAQALEDWVMMSVKGSALTSKS
jgi:GNAT superfamily N-acetyltransferase